MTNPNIPPEIADATPAPAPVRIPPDGMTDEEARIAARPVRISPEVREFIIDTLSNMDIWTPDQLDMREDAIAFVEALP